MERFGDMQRFLSDKNDRNYQQTAGYANATNEIRRVRKKTGVMTPLSRAEFEVKITTRQHRFDLFRPPLKQP